MKLLSLRVWSELDAAERARILAEMRQPRTPLWSDVTISGVASEANQGVVGKTVDKIAEERGMIADLGRWVLRRACEDAIHWPGVRLAVNISTIQFRHQDFLPGVKRILDETGLTASAGLAANRSVT